MFPRQCIVRPICALRFPSYKPRFTLRRRHLPGWRQRHKHTPGSSLVTCDCLTEIRRPDAVMTVTEFAVLHCVAGTPTKELRGLLARAQAEQAKWCDKYLPEFSPAAVERTSIFRQVEDPLVVLLCAAWPSVEAHWLWIQSEENQAVMGSLTGHIVTEGDKKVDLLHVEGDVFAAPEDPVLTPLLSSPVISFGRLFVAPEKKAAFEEKHDQVKHIIHDFVKPYLGKAGWRVDKEGADAKDEYVAVSGWPDIDQHKAFAQADGYPKYAELLPYIDGADVKHYQRIQ